MRWENNLAILVFCVTVKIVIWNYSGCARDSVYKMKCDVSRWRGVKRTG